MIQFQQLLKDDPALIAFNQNKPGLASLSSIEESLLISTAFTTKKQTMVIVKGNLYAAQQFYYYLYPLVKDDVLLLTVEESLRVEAVAASSSIYASQVDVLTQIVTSDKPKIIITHPSAIIRFFPTKETFIKHIISLKVNDTYDMNKMKDLQWLSSNC